MGETVSGKRNLYVSSFWWKGLTNMRKNDKILLSYTIFDKKEGAYKRVMKKKSKAGLIVATVILGVLCVAMAAACILLYSNGSAEKLNQKSRKDTKSDFEETEEYEGDGEISGKGEDFEVVVNTPVPESPEEGEGTGEGQEGNTDYLCAESSQRELTEDDVTALQSMTVEGLPADKGIIQMVINEIYARRGYQFEDQSIQDYFNSKAWYQEIAEKTDNMDTVLESMTEIERANVEFLSAYVQ